MEKREKPAGGWRSSKQLVKSIWLMAAIHQLELCIVCVTLTVRQILINSLFSLCYIIYNDFLWKSNHYRLYISNLTLTGNELCSNVSLPLNARGYAGHYRTFHLSFTVASHFLCLSQCSFTLIPVTEI